MNPNNISDVRFLIEHNIIVAVNEARYLLGLPMLPDAPQEPPLPEPPLPEPPNDGSGAP